MPMQPVDKQAHYLLQTRLAIRHFIRVRVVSRLLKSLDFNIQEVTPSRLKDIKNVKEGKCNIKVDREYMFKVSTCKGKAANIQTERFLFSTHEIRDAACSMFLKEYIDDTIISEGKPIKHTSQSVTTKKNTNNKVSAAKIE